MTQADPIVSVVVPTHNRLHLMPETVASVLGQTRRDIELIVVDDCSLDGTWEWLNRMDDPRLRPVRMEQHGERSAARNTGLRMARGAHVLFLDDDDLLTERALETHLAALEAHPAAIGSIGSLRLFDTKGGEGDLRIIDRQRAQSIWRDLLFGWAACCGQILFRTQFVRSVGGFDQTRSSIEDHVLMLQLTRLGPFALLPDVVLRYRLHLGTTRPKRMGDIMNTVRREAAAKLEGRERRLAERILEARSLFCSGAEDLPPSGTPWGHIGRILRAGGTLASICAGSPLMRYQITNKLWKGLEKCTFGLISLSNSGWEKKVDLSVRGESSRDGRFFAGRETAEKQPR